MVREIRGGRHAVRWVVVALALAASTGCVKRRYTIRTDPPGALVYVNGEELGSSPVSRSFVYYGDREILLVAPDGTQKKVIQKLDAPLYDNALTDFVTENLLPVTLRDEREFFYKIEPAPIPETEGLRQRAAALRQQGNQPPPPRPKGFFARLREMIFGPA